MRYAKETEQHTLQYPTQAEFIGIPNWEHHDPALRARKYMPLVGESEYRPGYEAEPATWHVVNQSETHTEPRQEKVPVYEENPETHETEIVGYRTEMVDKDITTDTSYVQVDAWEYIPIPEPEPPVVRYSRYLIKRACERRGLWEQVKAAIEQAGKWESFVLIQSLDTSNAELQEAMPLLVAKFGQETVDEVLAESVAE